MNTIEMTLVALMRSARQAGWPAAVGAVLMIAAVSALWSANQPLRDEIAALSAQGKQLRTQARSNTAPPLSAGEQLRQFYAAFPPRSSLPDTLMRLHRIASSKNLQATRADYRDAPEAGTPLVRVKIEVPVTGSYAAIREWIAELLKTQSNLTLEGLELNRSDIGKLDLNARVRFMLLLRSTS